MFIGPGGPKFSANILIRDQVFQDQYSSDRLLILNERGGG